MGTDPVTIHAELGLADDQRPEGRLWTDEGAERVFVGWLELIGALEELAQTGELGGRPAGEGTPGSKF